MFHCMWGHVYTDAQRADVLNKLAAAGVRWVRIDLGWSSVETSKGSYNAAVAGTFRNCVQMANDRGISVLAVVAETPGWANGGAAKNVPPSNPSDYGNFLAWATGQFPGVAAWQIYNEPNLSTFWSGSVAQYVGVLRAGYAAIKAANSSDKVITGGITFNNGPGWVRELYANGGKGHFDAIGTHPYQVKADMPPSYAADSNTWWFPNNTPAVRQVMAENQDTAKQIWITEFGYSAHEDSILPSTSTDYWWALGVSEAEQAQFTVDAIKYQRANWSYVGLFTYYKERSYSLSCCGLSPQWFAIHTENYGLLNIDGSPRPVYNALKLYLTGS